MIHFHTAHSDFLGSNDIAKCHIKKKIYGTIRNSMLHTEKEDKDYDYDYTGQDKELKV